MSIKISQNQVHGLALLIRELCCLFGDKFVCLLLLCVCFRVILSYSCYTFSLFHRSYTLYVFYFVFFIFNLSPSSRCPYCPEFIVQKKKMKTHDNFYYNAPSPTTKSHHFRHLYHCCCSPVPKFAISLIVRSTWPTMCTATACLSRPYSS